MKRKFCSVRSSPALMSVAPRRHSALESEIDSPAVFTGNVAGYCSFWMPKGYRIIHGPSLNGLLGTSVIGMFDTMPHLPLIAFHLHFVPRNLRCITRNQ